MRNPRWNIRRRNCAASSASPCSPAKRRPLKFPCAASSLGYWDTNKQSFVVEPGKLELRVGASSADIRLKKTVSIIN